MKLEQLAVQLYTLREHLQQPEQIPETLRLVAEIGYRAIQVSGIGKDVPDEVVTAAAREHGLVICARHDPGGDILSDPAAVAARVKRMASAHTAYPFPAGIDFGDESSVAGLIEQLNRAGKIMAEAGVTLSYHNHHHEFRKLDGRIILERIFAETDPAYVKAELDTYWVQYGGGNPVAWCRRMAGRIPLLHLKDYRITDQAEITFAEIGAGNLDFVEIVEAAEAGGCEWFIVEQDECPGDPFESLRQSFEFARNNLVRP